MTRHLIREIDRDKKIAVILDSAGFHHAKTMTDLYATSQRLERITLICVPLCPRPQSDRARVERHQN